MLNEDLTKTEIKKIVNDEMKKIVKDEISKELTSSLKTGSGKDEVNTAIKRALNSLYKFMYTKRNVWNGDIK